MDFDAYTIERAADAAGPDAMQALGKEYDRKITQFFGTWIIIKRAEVEGLDGADVAAIRWAEAIRSLPRFRIDRADFDGFPIFDFDFRAPQLPAGAHRLRFGDTWFLWKRSAISIPIEMGTGIVRPVAAEMIYRVNLSPGPRWE